MKFRKDLPDASSGGGVFLKLDDNESVAGIFVGEPYEFFQKWEAGKSHVVPEGTQGASFRFRLNFVVKDGENYMPKVFENGITVYKQLDELNEEYDLTSTVVKLTRKGLGKETTYSLLPLLKHKVTDETIETLKGLELHSLAHKEEPPVGDEPPF